MAKNKPRYNPNKPQNKIGNTCNYYEELNDGYHCEHGYDITKYKGNPHNCKKVQYQILASRSDIQKNNGVNITKGKY